MIHTVSMRGNTLTTAHDTLAHFIWLLRDHAGSSARGINQGAPSLGKSWHKLYVPPPEGTLAGPNGQ